MSKLSKTPAPKSERISGSKVNPKGTSATEKSAKSIKFDAKTLKSIYEKVKEHNQSHPNKKVTISVAKAVVRRGMGAYSSTHRPTIKGGKPNSRVAWGLARLNAFLFKVVKGKSKSGKYSQDNDLLDELGIKHQKFEKGGLIAPNGKPSNLTPEQYKLVRTPEFKAWFGDWENDPENASKVVDSNGEPLVVWHTTDKEFTIFNKKKSKEGFFFSPQKQRLSVYNKKNIYSYFLNLRNPSHEIFENDLKYLFSKGYDGIMDYGHASHLGNENLYEIIAFEPNQIKLADGTNTTFDANNPDIRYKDGGEVDDHKETYKKWKSLVNMSKSELEKFYNSEEGKEAGLSSSEAKQQGIDSGRESARMIMKMKETPKSDWTPNMWRWAKKQISFISRMSGNKGGLYDEKGRKTRKHTSLLIWGHNPKKYNMGGKVTDYKFSVVIKNIKNPEESFKSVKNKYRGAYSKIFDILNDESIFVEWETSDEIIKGNNFYLYFDAKPEQDKIEKISKIPNVEILNMYNDGGEVTDACIEEVVNIFNSIQRIRDWFITDGKLVIVFEDELMINSVEQMNYNLEQFKECHDVLDTEVNLNYGEDYKSIYINLKKDDMTIGKYADGGTMDVRMEDTVQRMDDPNFADISYYKKGGKTSRENLMKKRNPMDERHDRGAFSDYKKMMAKGGRINYSEYYAEGGVAKTCEIIDKDGDRKIDRESIEKLTECVNQLPQTKDFFYDYQSGQYDAKRKELHKKIMYGVKKNLVCVNRDEPIAILMGGSPASGKSTFLKKYRPYLLQEEILKIDADEIRSKLPEYKGWNATQTHLETKDIVNVLLSDRNIGIPCKFDVIYDGTMNNTKNYMPLIKLLKSLGYRVFVVYIDKVPKNVIVNRALERYKKSGRFVPLEVIDDFFEKGKTALNEIKKEVDGYMIVDGSDTNYHVIERGGMQLPKNRRYSNIGEPIQITTEDVVREYKKGGEINADNPKLKNMIEHKSGSVGGMLVGKRHSEGGIKAINKSTNQPLEMEGGEVVITRNAVSDTTKREFEGKMMTNKEILSKINESGGGVSFAKGGKVSDCGCDHYNAGGKIVKDEAIINKMKKLYPQDFKKGIKEEMGEHKTTFRDLRKDKISVKKATEMVVAEHLKSKPDYYKKYDRGGFLKLGMQSIPSLDEFVRVGEPINSPFSNENSLYYKIKDSFGNGVSYYKDGNKKSRKISDMFAYETYLWDNFGILYSKLPAKVKNALNLGNQKLIDKYINS